MKAAEDIDVPNFKAFEKGQYDNKKNLQSYFRVNKGEDFAEALKKLGYSEKQIEDSVNNILKGNPHWLILEDEVDKKVSDEAKEEKLTQEARFHELKALKKQEQEVLLKKLNVKKIPRLEGDRVRLIMELERA